MTTDLAEYRQADLDPYNECRMMDAERRKNEKANEKDYSTFDGSGTGGSGTESGGCSKDGCRKCTVAGDESS